MAKQNKSTTIALLVVAGVLLFLVGSFTGATSWFTKYRYDTTQTTTGLTTQQKQDVLNMLGSCSIDSHNVLKKDCDTICKENNRLCAFGLIHKGTSLGPTPELTNCLFPISQDLWNNGAMMNCVCCKP